MAALFKKYTFEDYKVRKATVEDTEAVIKILRDAAIHLNEKGIVQWEYLRSGNENDEMKRAISDGETYVVESKYGLAATFNLSAKQNEWDMEMWGKRNDHAYYIHRLAVAENARNKQVGKKILAWLDNNILLKDGYIRLDCVANNAVLNDYYRQAGFTFIAYAGEGENRFSLYEKAFLR
ncbi:GNAT family N-acetyltransferase [Oceanobacillus saliphilus]|uniref:GNAT family N-acetyltransferase n=1 Tax=Oceanobacillus saliphilus TaxID=2925834 RepID=UPI00201D4DFF|nr:GNAT family N-acetyltransferase [Oceanobacillus saliphilus]